MGRSVLVRKNGSGFLFECIGTSGCRSFRLEIVQRADICNQLPNLVFRDLSAPGGHPVRPPFHDRVEDIGGLTAVNPVALILLDKRRSDAPAAIRMTTGAVIPVIETLSFGNGVSVSFVGIANVQRVPALMHRPTGIERTLNAHVAEDAGSSR